MLNYKFVEDEQNKLIKKAKLTQSMSRKGECLDNAPMESFFKTFKVEEVYHEKYESHEQAARAANDYIERFYNPIPIYM